MDRQVAAEHGESAVGALVRGVRGAVGVLDDVTDDQLLLLAEAEGLGRLDGGRVGVGYERRTLGSTEIDGGRTRVGLSGVACLRRGGVGGGGAGLDADGEQCGGGNERAGRGGTPVGV